jgi:hypothetical protein
MHTAERHETEEYIKDTLCLFYINYRGYVASCEMVEYEWPVETDVGWSDSDLFEGTNVTALDGTMHNNENSGIAGPEGI